MSLIKNLISESLREQESRLVLEALKVEPAVAKEMINISSALSGAALAAAWASLGTAATAASIKGLLLAAGFTNPVTISALGLVAAGVVAAGVVTAGGKVAYNLSKDATRGVFNASESQRAAGDLLDAVIKRDKALSQKKESSIIKTTEKMQKKAKVLHAAAIKDLKKGVIDKKTYHTYLNLAEKGVIGRLSTLV